MKAPWLELVGSHPAKRNGEDPGRLALRSPVLLQICAQHPPYQAYLTESFSHVQVSCFCLYVCVWKGKQRQQRTASQLFSRPISQRERPCSIIKTGSTRLFIYGIAPGFLTTPTFSHFWPQTQQL